MYNLDPEDKRAISYLLIPAGDRQNSSIIDLLVDSRSVIFNLIFVWILLLQVDQYKHLVQEMVCGHSTPSYFFNKCSAVLNSFGMTVTFGIW